MAKREIQEPIQLTDLERDIFDVLLSTKRSRNLSVVLRCAGGWVRDKMLGLDSLDIDIALDNLMGRDFADEINAYLGSQNKPQSRPHVIQQNPDQSKHLETARMRVQGVELDLVNLRSETYAAGACRQSHPQVDFGTPEQDALRRDFTINSLFYNIDTEVVEDLTGRGKEDLKAGLIRTPLPASETFQDDPLRVLRAVRFASRFNFELDSSLVAAARSSEVQAALGSKVSRERFGEELGKVMTGQNPAGAFATITDLGMFPIVFQIPSTVEPALRSDPGRACSTLMGAAAQVVSSQPGWDAGEKKALLIAALLLPFRLARVPVKKGKTQPLASWLILNALKWGTQDAKAVDTLHEQSQAILEAFPAVKGLTSSTQPDQEAHQQAAAQVGKAFSSLKSLCKAGLHLMPLLALDEARPLGVADDAAELALAACQDSLQSSQPDQHPDSVHHRLEQTKLLADWAAFLDECWTWKELFDGREVQDMLNLQKPERSRDAQVDPIQPDQRPA
ncbi:hypothetical protein WJX84_009114 [Apatococcus fuscideae]|uniref:Poly A polymerase head domain-containing protein n=1 Tax=Apatococcus fuscideae TaxID=2026836 RepID=A0AAW1T411_9CHLO